MSRDLELEKQIDAYIKGKLSEQQEMELWVKLLQRPGYIELMETELGLKSIFEKQKSSGSPDDTSTSSTEERGVVYSLQKYSRWIAAAAAVVLIVVALNIFQFSSGPNLNNLAVKHFNLTKNLSSAEILRSQSDDLTIGDSLLNEGFEAAISGNIEKALSVYEKIITNHSNDPAAAKAYLNKGLIQYNKGEFEQSSTSFKRATERITEDRRIVKEKAYWYLGNAYINIDHLTDARDAIQNVYDMDGIYRNSAYRLLQKIDYKLGNIDYDELQKQLNEKQ